MADDQVCPICSTRGDVRRGIWDAVVDCVRCGGFTLTRPLSDDLPGLLESDALRAPLMSHTLRRMQQRGERVTIDPSTIESYWSRGRLPSPSEQADDLILWIGDNQPNNASAVTTKELSLDAWIGADLPQQRGTATGLRWLVQAMEPDPKTTNFFQHRFGGGGDVVFQLTLAGWQRYASLKQAQNESRTAFMAMKFGDAELEGVVKSCFRPAVARTGFELRDLQDHKRAGLIDDQIKAGLLAARFVVADLTHGSFGAYWEAGFADGRGLPVIYTCKATKWADTKTHFDTNHMATVIWDVSDLKSAADELTAIIRTTLRADAKQTDE